MTEDTPKPGSHDAHVAGCICPIMDNAHGRGYMGQEGIYVMRVDCPLHGSDAPKKPKPPEEP